MLCLGAGDDTVVVSVRDDLRVILVVSRQVNAAAWQHLKMLVISFPRETRIHVLRHKSHLPCIL